MSDNATYSLHLPSERSAITLVEPFLRSISELAALGPSRFHDLHVALTEAVNNAIIHGNRCQPECFVDVEVRTTPAEIAVMVRDVGTGFDVQAVPDPTLPENILREGGRGIFLIRHLADAVEFHDGMPGTVVILRYFPR